MIVAGTGTPVTVAAHGLGMTVTETRPLLSGVPGTRVFPEARAHGGAPAAVDPSYTELAADLLAVADSCGATQALGASMGAGALLRILSEHPSRFERVVLFLPAVLSTPRPPVDLAAALALEVPPGDYLEERVRRLADPEVQRLAAGLAGDVAVTETLAAVTAEVLVIGQEGDPLHPASVAREVAAALPRARLHVFDRPGVLLHARRELRDLIAPFLTPARLPRP